MTKHRSAFIGIVLVLICVMTVAAAFAHGAGAASVGQPPVFDFDGDGKTDCTVVRGIGTGGNNQMQWYILRSTAGPADPLWGSVVTDKMIPADYDGDHKWDIAVYRPGTSGNPGIFYIMRSSTGTFDYVYLGTDNDEVIETQDFDGDGKADPTVVRDVSGTLVWYSRLSVTGQIVNRSFGATATDVPIRGDFDGDLKADVAVYRTGGTPANSFFVWYSSDGGVRVQPFGVFSTDYVVPADFDGDGKTDYAVWRGAQSGTDGRWYWIRSSDGVSSSVAYGLGPLDRPVPGDYDGDGKTDQAIWRPGLQSNFWINGSLNGSTVIPWGIINDVPTAFTVLTR